MDLEVFQRRNVIIYLETEKRKFVKNEQIKIGTDQQVTLYSQLYDYCFSDRDSLKTLSTVRDRESPMQFLP